MLTQAVSRVMMGSKNERALKKMKPLVKKINAWEESFASLSDDELRAKTKEFQQRVSQGETLEMVLPEAFAVVRLASHRVLGLRHFDTQLIGGIVLHQGRIAEMGTGEGKTLVATLPAYLNALTGDGVHIVTVNDYLAQRDAAWMGKIHHFLGLSVGCVTSTLPPELRKAAYACDVVYATNNELGFDYLRGNMALEKDLVVQRALNYAIVDEVDSIFIDEARTPLIISGPTEDITELYRFADSLVQTLPHTAYDIDEKARRATFTDEGVELLEKALRSDMMLDENESLFDAGSLQVLHHLNQALRAHKLFAKDKDYMVRGDDLVIVDEFTGRALAGRRFSDGLHQALEAKENLKINPENQTLASVTYQNYFRHYSKIGGMTGTAATERDEFYQIYGLEVVEVPPYRPNQRVDDPDRIYKTAKAKAAAIIAEVKAAHDKGQPVLIGTTSIESSEYFSQLLKKENLEHSVLNARYHEQEASIIAQAGRKGAITIATNMAGRGTDIKLGGSFEALLEQEKSRRETIQNSPLTESEEADIKAALELQVASEAEAVCDVGGLFVVGTERHDSRRIDNQLKGRAGRQGDPGRSAFFLSLQDDLLRIFGGNMERILSKMGLSEDDLIQGKMISNVILKAQTRIEERNFEIRKQLLRFDDVVNEQRKVVYEERNSYLNSENIRDHTKGMVKASVTSFVQQGVLLKEEAAEPEAWDELQKDILHNLGQSLDLPAFFENKNEETLIEVLVSKVLEKFEEKEQFYSQEAFAYAERQVSLQVLDQLWKEQLLALDYLKQSVSLQGYGQKEPLQVYKQEGFDLFKDMMNNYDREVVRYLTHIQLKVPQPTL